MENFPSLVDFILAILFGVLLPIVSGLRSREVFKEIGSYFDSRAKKRFYIGNSFFLAIMAMVVLAAWYFFGRPFDVLGFATPEENGKTYPWWLIILFIMLYLMDVLHSVLNPHELQETKDQLETQTPFMPTLWREMPAYFLMCVSAGVCEEIVFRGFLVNFFKSIFNGFPAQAAWTLITPSLIFAAAHYYQGAKAVFKILVLSMLFGLIFWMTGSLYIVMLLHFLVDFFSGILSVKLANRE